MKLKTKFFPSLRSGYRSLPSNHPPWITGLTCIVNQFNYYTHTHTHTCTHAHSDSQHPGLDSGPAVFGVVKRIHDNDMDTHSNQQVGHSVCMHVGLSVCDCVLEKILVKALF